MPTTTIDIHPHIIANDAARYPLAPLGGHQSDWSRTRPVSLEQLIAAMDEAGVQKAAIVQASTCYGHDNSYVADAVAAHPERFTGVFSVDVLASDASQKMRAWYGRGLSGMRLFTFGSTMSDQASWLDDPKTYPAWECAGELGLSICLQMSAKAIPQARRMAARFPHVHIILDHGARPELADGPPYNAAASLFDLARHTNIYLKLTPRIFTESRRGKATPDTFFPQLVSSFGASRLAWGSNYPSSEGTLPQLLATARESLACLADGDQDWIFARTAQALYPALAD
jgi:L-fuconolactonase